MRKKRPDNKTIAIIVLSVLVALEAFFLLSSMSQKTALLRKRKEAAIAKKEPVIKKEIMKGPAVVSPAEEAVVKKPSQGKIAIIVDDCGYTLQPCQYSSSVKNPITFSILPDLKHSTAVAECVHENQKGIMLHLPMEPHYNPDHYPDDYLITTIMKKPKVENIIAHDIENIPYVEGVNNHMGSKATEDTELMTIVLKDLKKRGLFFVDSVVTNKTVCPAVAKITQIPFTRRDVFLDNKNERNFIEGQFAEAVQIAKKKGYVVIIGHDRKLTMEIIKEQTELLSAQGFQFITVKDLILEK